MPEPRQSIRFGTRADNVRIARLNSELPRIMKLPEIRDQWTATGAEIGGNTPDEFAAFVRGETERWGRLIRERGIKPN